MTSPFKTKFIPFHQALARCVEENLATVTSLCEAAEVSDQTIRNWMADATRVDEAAAHRVAAHHPNPEVRRILMEARCSGSEFLPTAQESRETDLDGDGRTTARDLMLAIAQINESTAKEMRRLAASSLSAEVLQQAADHLQRVRAEVTDAILILDKCLPRERSLRITGT